MTEPVDTSTPPAGDPPGPDAAAAPDVAAPAQAAAAPAPSTEDDLLQQFTATELEAPIKEKPPRFADSYGLVLALLITSYFVTAIGGNSTWGRALSLVVLAATTWLSLRASQVERRVLRWALALIPVVTIVAVVAVLLGSDETGRGVTAALTIMLVVVAPVAIVRRLTSHMVVNLNTFYGAVCIYLLLAMFFASAYALTGIAYGGQFFAQITPPARATSLDFLYFSFITMTTVGYGDLTAAGSVGRMLASLEAILGQLYLITVVALVVQNLGQERRFKNFRDRIRK